VVGAGGAPKQGQGQGTVRMESRISHWHAGQHAGISQHAGALARSSLVADEAPTSTGRVEGLEVGDERILCVGTGAAQGA